MANQPPKPHMALISAAGSAGGAEPKPNSSSKPATLPAGSFAPVSPQMRRAMIAEAAYYIAQQRGFGSGSEVEDWLLAEKRLEAMLSA